MSACWVLTTSGTWHNLQPLGLVDDAPVNVLDGQFYSECGRKYQFSGIIRAYPPQDAYVCIVCKRKAAMRVLES